MAVLAWRRAPDVAHLLSLQVVGSSGRQDAVGWRNKRINRQFFDVLHFFEHIVVNGLSDSYAKKQKTVREKTYSTIYRYNCLAN